MAVSDSATWRAPDVLRDGLRIDTGDLASRELGGKRFGSDTYVTGGTTAALNMGGFGGRKMAPDRIVEAPLPQIYDYWREGENFSYTVPLPDGLWTVTVHMFEPRAATSGVAMSVSANGKPVLPPLDVTKAAGGALKGLARSFAVTVKGGVRKLDFSATGGKAVIAAIEVSR